MKDNPFSLYDFLGYLIPGLTAISLFFLVTACKEIHPFNFDILINSIPKFTLENTVVLIIVAYAVGHFLSYISSITIEKYSVWRFGYPSYFLLNRKKYRFREHFKTSYGKFWGIAILTIQLPTFILDYIFCTFLGFWFFYVKPLDNLLVSIILFKLQKFFDKQGINNKNGLSSSEYINSDYFRLIFHYYYERSKNHNSRFSNYLAIYGFLRTMTLIMNLIFWYLVIHFSLIQRINIKIGLLIFASAIISYVFFMAFMKFWRKFTLQGLMLLATDEDLK